MRNTIGLRLIFVLVLLQALLVGSAIVSPELIALVLPWPASPLNAHFAAALYLMGAVSALLSALARRYLEVRISLIQIGLITGALLLLTLPHLGEFTAADFPYRWVVFYALDVVIIGAVLWRLRGRDPPPRPGRHPAASILTSYAVATAVAGTMLLVAPELAVRLWPWPVTPILAQVYSVFFLTFAVGAWLAARDPRPAASRISVSANIVMLLLVLGVSVIDLDRFVAGPVTWIWFVLFTTAAVALTIALIRSRGHVELPEEVAR